MDRTTSKNVEINLSNNEYIDFIKSLNMRFTQQEKVAIKNISSLKDSTQSKIVFDEFLDESLRYFIKSKPNIYNNNTLWNHKNNRANYIDYICRYNKNFSDNMKEYIKSKDLAIHILREICISTYGNLAISMSKNFDFPNGMGRDEKIRFLLWGIQNSDQRKYLDCLDDNELEDYYIRVLNAKLSPPFIQSENDFMPKESQRNDEVILSTPQRLNVINEYSKSRINDDKNIYRMEVRYIFSGINMCTGIEQHFEKETIEEVIRNSYIDSFNYYADKGQEIDINILGNVISDSYENTFVLKDVFGIRDDFETFQKSFINEGSNIVKFLAIYHSIFNQMRKVILKEIFRKLSLEYENGQIESKTIEKRIENMETYLPEMIFLSKNIIAMKENNILIKLFNKENDIEILNQLSYLKYLRGVNTEDYLIDDLEFIDKFREEYFMSVEERKIYKDSREVNQVNKVYSLSQERFDKFFNELVL